MVQDNGQFSNERPLVTGGPRPTPPGRLPPGVIRTIVIVDLIAVLPTVGLYVWASLTGGQARILQVAPIAILIMGIAAVFVVLTLRRALAAQKQQSGG